ncbi:TetR family transcriptional regulator [Streptomyces indicus]|uniref:DNA-binding transcriptional regulator, AcrR family n=1 Tax=Streptomyces indicus TaxID=417292 RepID=A0A1G9ILI3_9ACTN|nr:TetR family transcriptional regulator [Streptomyces indicus]SDL25980.1 DNA-binding transcriptional regulator, AcrR family [Streptomyces indicus]
MTAPQPTATGPAAPRPPASAPGLRERKKQRTRDALVRAALELFTTQGYERTTVDEIVAAVDVSQRTFFRYFAGKEQVVFAVQEMVESRFVESLRARPAHEPPFEALRRSVLDAWDSIGESIEELVPVEMYMRCFRMIESTPALLAVQMRRTVETEEEIVRLVAAREGLDPDEDPRPRVAVAAFSGVMQLAGRRWGAGEEISVESMRRLTASLLDRLEPSLAGDWRRPGRGAGD